MKITREMVTQLNSELSNMGCSFRYRFEDRFGGNTQIQIEPSNMKFIDSYILNVNDEFYDWLRSFFKIRGIELSYNNDGSIMWSKSGWKNEEEE